MVIDRPLHEQSLLLEKTVSTVCYPTGSFCAHWPQSRFEGCSHLSLVARCGRRSWRLRRFLRRRLHLPYFNSVTRSPFGGAILLISIAGRTASTFGLPYCSGLA